MKRKIALFLALTLCFALLPTFCACKKENNEEINPLAPTHIAIIEIQNYGVIELELYGNVAPITVKNFVKLANDGFYNGLTFHRIINGFMMQGGGYDVNGIEKKTASIKGEFESNGIENPILHTRGVISMARAPAADSASSQFFIMHDDADWLDGDYAAFGKVTSGMDIVDKICSEATPYDSNGSIYISKRPVITSITITEK